MSRIVLAVGMCLVVGSLAAAQPKDPAEVFPATTITYAELRDPAAVADSIAALVKGTSLEDGLKLLHDRRDANKDARLFQGMPGLSFAATITSPEFLSEFRKLRGIGVGFTGLTNTHEPKIVLAALLGDSTTAGLLARTYLANEATFRRVDVINGVAIFQSRAPAMVTYDPNTGQPIVPEAKKAAEGPLEWTFAYTPGLFIIASNKTAITDVLTHWKGEGESLAKQVDFQSDANLRTAGINVFVRPHALVQAADAAKKARRDLLDPAFVSFLKLVVNSRATPSVSGHFAVAADGLRATVHVHHDAKQDSPLLEFLSGAITAGNLQTATTNLAAAWTIALPPATKRLAATLRLADAFATSHGEVGPLPSEWLAEAEEKTKIAIREKLIGSLEAVSILMPPRQELPANVEPLPLLALHCTTEKQAVEWRDAWPTLAACFMGTDTALSPTTETITGVKVFTVRMGAMAVHYAQSGTNVVLGLDRKWVANSLVATSARKAISIDATTSSYAVGLPLGLVQFDRLSAWFPEWKSNGPINFLGGSGFGGGPTNEAAAWFTDQELVAAFGPLPPLVGRTTKSANRLAIEFRFDFGAGGAKPIIDRLIPVIEKLGTRNLQPYHGGFFLDR